LAFSRIIAAAARVDREGSLPAATRLQDAGLLALTEPSERVTIPLAAFWSGFAGTGRSFPERYQFGIPVARQRHGCLRDRRMHGRRPAACRGCLFREGVPRIQYDAAAGFDTAFNLWNTYDAIDSRGIDV
jgi:hypothetical protein